MVAENPSLPINLGNDDSYSFKIFIDEQSMQLYDKNAHFGNTNWYPVSKKLMPYLNRQTRSHLMNRLQVLDAGSVQNISILKGKIVEIKNGVSGGAIQHIKDSKAGDVITLTASDNLTSSITIPNKSGGSNRGSLTSSFLLSSGDTFELTARKTISLVQLENGDWLEMNRN